jgi:hypothetical protein
MRGMLKSNNKNRLDKRNNSVAIYDDPIPKMLSQELKYSDTAISIVSIPSTGSFTKLVLPAQGTTSVTRVADRAYITRIEFTAFRYSQTLNDGIRLVLFQTKGLQTSAPAVTDLFTAVTPYAPYAYNARDLYEIIYDSQASISLGGDSVVHFYRKSFTPRVTDMKFIPGSSNVYNGQLYFMAIAVNAGCSNLLGNFRIWFEDSN